MTVVASPRPGAPRRALSRAGAATLAAFVVLGLGALASALASVSLETAQAPVIKGVILVVLASLPLIIRLHWNSIDLPGLYGLFSALFLGVTSLVWVGTPYLQTPRVLPSDVGAGLRLVALCLLAFGAGAWLVSRPKRPERVSFSRDSAPSRKVLVLAFGASVALTLPAFASQVYGYNATPGSLRFNAVISLLSAIGPLVALATALAYYGAGRRELRGALVVMVVVAAVLGFAAGYKQTALDAAILVMFAFFLCRGRYPWRAMGLAVLFVFLVLVPANTVFRNATREQGQSTQQAFQQTLSGTRGQVNAPIEDAFNYTFSRFRLIDAVALIRSATPNVYPYADGSKYEYLPALIVVPRAVWPAKPEFDEGKQFVHTYVQLPLSEDTATGMTEIGDLYRNFGVRGAIIGMFIWGIVLGVWQRFAGRGMSPRAAMLHGYAILHYGIYIESDIPNLVSIASKTLPVAIALAWLLLPGRSGVPGYRRLLAKPTRAKVST